MNRILLVVAVLIFIVSCQKKSTNHTRVYYCVKNDSTYSNIPSLNNPHYKDSSGFYSNYTDAQIAFFIKDFSHIDTVYNTPDTLMIAYWTVSCEATE